MKLWVSLGVVLVVSFAVLGYYGFEIYRMAPPIPEQVVSSDGSVVFTGQNIRDGQNVWQSIGGQQIGSIWGHGAYVAPDWSADWRRHEKPSLAAHRRRYGFAAGIVTSGWFVLGLKTGWSLTEETEMVFSKDATDARQSK